MREKNAKEIYNNITDGDYALVKGFDHCEFK